MSKPKKKIFDYFVYDFVKIVLGIPGIIWHRPRVIFENDEAKKKIRGGAIVISNHLGFFDPIYILYALWYRRPHFICLKSFFESRFAWAFRCFHCIPVDKQNAGIDTVRQVLAALNEEKVVVIFPEGSVNDGSGDMAQFKSGVSLMAVKSKKPIVPLYIKEKKHFLERITIIQGQPIDISERRITFAEMDNIANELREKENQLRVIAEKY